jgi:hypothetical protein
VLCILLRVYPLMLFLKTTVRNNVFCARFYCALLTHVSAPISDHLQIIYIYKNVTVHLCVCEFVQKHVNLRTLFTDGVAIWTQRCRRIRACLDITFIYILYIYIYRCKNMLLRFYGPEMALVVNGTQALSAVAETQRSRRISERERQWMAVCLEPCERRKSVWGISA